jgi:hypothetical protein
MKAAFAAISEPNSILFFRSTNAHYDAAGRFRLDSLRDARPEPIGYQRRVYSDPQRKRWFYDRVLYA